METVFERPSKASAKGEDGTKVADEDPPGDRGRGLWLPPRGLSRWAVWELLGACCAAGGDLTCRAPGKMYHPFWP